MIEIVVLQAPAEEPNNVWIVRGGGETRVILLDPDDRITEPGLTLGKLVEALGVEATIREVEIDPVDLAGDLWNWEEVADAWLRRQKMGGLYRDWLSVTNGDESAYPSEERLAQYQAWAEELVVGGTREKEGSEFRRFCRVRLEGQARGLGLDAAAKAYRNGRDFPPLEGWDCLRESDEHLYNRYQQAETAEKRERPR